MELWEHGLGQLARLVKNRQASSREVVESHLRRISAINPAVNALPRVLVDDAYLPTWSCRPVMAVSGQASPLFG
jgi:Asp-tRNA(Asn)/Glu-tRNA(Gln) amidotransferase A subunit family amidase